MPLAAEPIELTESCRSIVLLAAVSAGCAGKPAAQWFDSNRWGSHSSYQKTGRSRNLSAADQLLVRYTVCHLRDRG